MTAFKKFEVIWSVEAYNMEYKISDLMTGF